MERRSIDKLLTAIGAVIAITLLAAACGLLYAHHFIHSQVQQQLGSQQISFPEAGSKALTSLPDEDRQAVKPYAGQQLTTGAQAEVFANHYIANHLKNIADGKTYSELSSEAMADPNNSELAGKVSTMFRGEMLRGTLLNAYAFDTMATVARLAAYGALAASLVLWVLVILGLRRVHQAKK